MRVRDQRKNFFFKGITISWRIAEKIFDKANVSKDLIENVLLFEELAKGSKYIATIAKDLEKRNDDFILYVPYTGDKEIYYTDIANNHQLINDYYVTKEDKQTKTIKGQVGNKGKVQGIVKIICSIDNFDSFKANEIPVAGMTRPEYVPLMKKAKAIITDEGGITCHAAIVSRELNKPCIVGTRMATQILKDGDKVEVDADNGIVRILD